MQNPNLTYPGLNLAHLKKWTMALRSGKYEQGQGVLCHVALDAINDNDEFCCLGVVCEVMGLKGELKQDGVGGPWLKAYGGPDYARYQPPEVNNWLGLPPGNLKVDGPREVDYGWQSWISWDLASLNDDGFPFDQIADLIDYFGVTV